MLPTTHHFLRRHLAVTPRYFRVSFSTSFQRNWSQISTDDRSVTVDSLKTTFPYIWLRDACQSPECVHPSNTQRLSRTSDIQLDIKPVQGGVELTTDGIRVVWTDGHKSFYDRSFLKRHSSHAGLSAFHKDVPKQPWNNRDILSTGKNLFATYESLHTPAGLLVAIIQIAKYGLLFVSDVPNKETSNEKCELPTLARLFGDIRLTWYGRVWDVINTKNSTNIAYTDLNLGLHIDLPYFEHPPRYQILHCLRNRVTGGVSTFVDALHVADHLRKSHPSEFDVLTKTPVKFQYINDGHHLHRNHPTIELSSDGDIDYINYSPHNQAPLPLSTPPEFYPAFQRFAKMLDDPQNAYSYTLKEGDAVFFDNRRVLHARTAFSDIDGKVAEGETNRWLKGCYLEADAVMDRARVLQAQLEGNRS